MIPPPPHPARPVRAAARPPRCQLGFHAAGSPPSLTGPVRHPTRERDRGVRGAGPRRGERGSPDGASRAAPGCGARRGSRRPRAGRELRN